MSPTEDLLRQGAAEIRRLRQRNEVLEAQSRVVELFGIAMHAEAPRMGAAVDIAWSMDSDADRLQEARLAERN